MNASVVTSEVRRRIVDEDAEPHFSNAELFGHLDSAQADLKLTRPDLFVDASGADVALVSVSALTTALLVGTEWKEALVAYVMAKLLMTDDADRMNEEKARRFMEDYETAKFGRRG